MALPVLATDIGFTNDPTQDNTPAWNALVSAPGNDWVVFYGTFYFKTQPLPSPRSLRLEGIGVNRTSFMRDFVPAASTDALFEFQATSTIERFALNASQGMTGAGLKFSGLAASASVVRDAYISAGASGQWLTPLWLTSPDPLGIRSVHLQNIELFAANGHLFWGVNVKGLTLLDVNCYPAGGTVDHVTIQHNGANRSANVFWTTRYLTKLYAYNSDYIKIRGLTPVTILGSGSTNVSNA